MQAGNIGSKRARSFNGLKLAERKDFCKGYLLVRLSNNVRCSLFYRQLCGGMLKPGDGCLY